MEGEGEVDVYTRDLNPQAEIGPRKSSNDQPNVQHSLLLTSYCFISHAHNCKLKSKARNKITIFHTGAAQHHSFFSRVPSRPQSKITKKSNSLIPIPFYNANAILSESNPQCLSICKMHAIESKKFSLSCIFAHELHSSLPFVSFSCMNFWGMYELVSEKISRTRRLCLVGGEFLWGS